MKFLTILSLLWWSFGLLAQQDGADQSGDEAEDKKKPSWSTGLPERQAAPTMNTPDLSVEKPRMDVGQPEVVEMPTTDLAIEQPSFSMPAIEMAPVNDDGNVPPAAKSSSRSRPVNNRTEDTSETSSQAEAVVTTGRPYRLLGEQNYPNGYVWEALVSEPVKIPKSLSFSYKEIQLEVHINPAGEVVKVRRLDDVTSTMLLNYSSRALKEWQFRPPAEFGIEEVLVNSMLVDMVAR